MPSIPLCDEVGVCVWVGWIDVPSVPLYNEVGVWGLGRVCPLYPSVTKLGFGVGVR